MLEEEKDWFVRYQKLDYKERRKLGKNWNPVTFKRKKRRELFTEDYINELIEKVHKKNLWSKKLYDKYRKENDKSLPSLDAIADHFNGWETFKKMVFTEEELKELGKSAHRRTENMGKKPYDDAKLFATIQFFNLRTHKDFMRAHEAFPDLVPCQKTIYNHFGGYKNLRKMVMARDIKSILEKYIIICNNFGIRRMTPYHCRRNGIDIDWAIDRVGSKKKFYELVDFARETFNFAKSIEEAKNKLKDRKNENRRTNKAKN